MKDANKLGEEVKKLIDELVENKANANKLYAVKEFVTWACFKNKTAEEKLDALTFDIYGIMKGME